MYNNTKEIINRMFTDYPQGYAFVVSHNLIKLWEKKKQISFEEFKELANYINKKGEK